MRCPHCGNEIPDNNNNIYCPACNQIANQEVLLRMKIEKRLHNQEEKEPVNKAFNKPVKDRTIRQNDYTGDKNSTVYTIISVLVVAVIIVGVFFLNK